MLAMHESVQQRVFEEINEVLGPNKDVIIDNEKLSELKYVEAVIKETLRLFSPATGKRTFTPSQIAFESAINAILKAFSEKWRPKSTWAKLEWVSWVFPECFLPLACNLIESLDDCPSGVKNLVLPAGTNLVINIHQMHRKKEIWGEDAEDFHPDRFLGEEVNKRHNYSFLPFASGIRQCIGRHFRSNLNGKPVRKWQLR